jgi:hypothetical protein
MKNQLASKIIHIATLCALPIGLCAIVSLNRCHGAQRKVFFEPGLFSIETPDSETADARFSWKYVQTVQNTETTTLYFTCTQKDRLSPLLVLAVDERQANTDVARRAIVKAHYKALQRVVVSSGFKLDSKRPKIKTPIQDRVVYGVSGTKEDGSKIFVAGMILFKNRIYMIQSSAASATEAKRLIDVGNSFQEL